MTYQGRQMLYRVEIYCSREWAEALGREENRIASATDPFEVNAWRDALAIVYRLRRGFSALADRTLNLKGET